MEALKKCNHIIIDRSIKDSEILALVSALMGSIVSAQMTHAGMCAQLRIEQVLEYSLRIDMPESMSNAGLPDLLSKILTCPHSINEGDLKYVAIEQTFNYDDIYNLAKPSGRSFAQVAGILIGGEAPSIFDLTPAVVDISKDVENLALLVDLNILQNNWPIAKFIQDDLKLVPWFTSIEDIKSYQEMLVDVVNASIIIGPPSFYTYAACCLGIPCIEIYDSREQLSVFSKWSAIKYAAILVDELDNVTQARLTKMWSVWQATLPDIPDNHILGGADGS